MHPYQYKEMEKNSRLLHAGLLFAAVALGVRACGSKPARLCETVDVCGETEAEKRLYFFRCGWPGGSPAGLAQVNEASHSSTLKASHTRFQ